MRAYEMTKKFQEMSNSAEVLPKTDVSDDREYLRKLGTAKNMTVLDMLKRRTNSMNNLEGVKLLPKITLKQNEDQQSTIANSKLPPLAPTPAV